jgi:hypothetical protein
MMPIVNDAAAICKGPLVAFGCGDIYFCPAGLSGEPVHYLLLYDTKKQGAIGDPELTGRETDEPIPHGGNTGDHPADLALRFENVESVDAIMRSLGVIRAALDAAEGRK